VLYQLSYLGESNTVNLIKQDPLTQSPIPKLQSPHDHLPL